MTRHDETITLRLPEDLLTQLDELVKVAEESDRYMAASNVNRSTIIRHALMVAIPKLWEEFDPHGTKRGKSKSAKQWVK